MSHVTKVSWSVFCAGLRRHAPAASARGSRHRLPPLWPLRLAGSPRPLQRCGVGRHECLFGGRACASGRHARGRQSGAGARGAGGGVYEPGLWSCVALIAVSCLGASNCVMQLAGRAREASPGVSRDDPLARNRPLGVGARPQARRRGPARAPPAGGTARSLPRAATVRAYARARIRPAPRRPGTPPPPPRRRRAHPRRARTEPAPRVDRRPRKATTRRAVPGRRPAATPGQNLNRSRN